MSSGKSLRRQMFHRNLDRLIQDSPLHPVQEENGDKRDKQQDVGPRDQEETTWDSAYSDHRPDDSLEINTPIYRPKAEGLKMAMREEKMTVRPVSEYENCDSPAYAEPWTPGLAQIHDVPPPLPAKTKTIAQEDAEMHHYRKKMKAQLRMEPVVFQYPDLHNDLPQSPIHGGPLHSSTPHWSGTQPMPDVNNNNNKDPQHVAGHRPILKHRDSHGPPLHTSTPHHSLPDIPNTNNKDPHEGTGRQPMSEDQNSQHTGNRPMPDKRVLHQAAGNQSKPEHRDLHHTHGHHPFPEDKVLHQVIGNAGESHQIGTMSRGCERETVKALPLSPALCVATQETISPGPGPREDELMNPRCQTIMEHSIFSSPECSMCRICHEDGSKEPLVSPCFCTGTMGMLHVSCLQRWLGSSRTTRCEICQFQFTVLKKRHPIKWYIQEPSLRGDRRATVKDVSLMVCLTLLVTVISVLCLTFADRHEDEGKTAPAVVLVIIAGIAVLTYFVWLGVMCRRMHHRFSELNETHHVVQILQSDKPRSKIFRRFSLTLAGKGKEPHKESRATQENLRSSTYISYSLESYKAAMLYPVDPPLLGEPGDLTMLDVDSPSVMSLDDYDNAEAPVSFYQPPEQGHTSVLCSTETGRLLRETGV